MSNKALVSLLPSRSFILYTKKNIWWTDSHSQSHWTISDVDSLHWTFYIVLNGWPQFLLRTHCYWGHYWIGKQKLLFPNEESEYCLLNASVQFVTFPKPTSLKDCIFKYLEVTIYESINPKHRPASSTLNVCSCASSNDIDLHSTVIHSGLFQLWRQIVCQICRYELCKRKAPINVL